MLNHEIDGPLCPPANLLAGVVKFVEHQAAYVLAVAVDFHHGVKGRNLNSDIPVSQGLGNCRKGSLGKLADSLLSLEYGLGKDRSWLQ